MTGPVDDGQLLRLAAAPPRDAAVVLNRGVAFWPLVLFLAVIPGLPVAWRSPVDESTGWLGLRALSVLHAETWDERLQPGVADLDRSLSHQPPFMSWLTAAVIPLWPAGSWHPLFLVKYVAVAFTVVVLADAATRMHSARLGVLLAFCLAVHPQLLHSISRSGGEAWGALWLSCALWGWVRHVTTSPRVISFSLLISGVAWGLSILTMGPVALLWWLATAFTTLVESSHDRVSELTAVGDGWTILRPYPRFASLVLLLTGLAASAWWIVAAAATDGMAFWLDWSWGSESGPSDSVGTEMLAWIGRSAWLGGWWVIGLFAAIHRIWKRAPDGWTRWSAYLVLWTVAGSVGLLIRSQFPRFNDQTCWTWETFLLLPATILAAQGLDLALRRQISSSALLLAVVVTISGVTWSTTGRFSLAVLVGFVTGVVLLASAPVAWSLRRTSWAWTEEELRFWVRGLAVASWCGHLAMNLPLFKGNPVDRRDWEEVRTRLTQIGAVDQTSLVTPAAAPIPQWEYLRAAIFPQAVSTRAAGWDPQLLRRLVQEAGRPRSRVLLVECHRRSLRVQGEVGSGWRFTTVLDPRPWHGHRVTAHLIAPQQIR
jgi:hypothetical protein